MDLKEIKQIIELMTENELSHFYLEREGMTIKLKKGMDAEAVQEHINALRAQAPAPAPVEPAPVAAAPAANPSAGAPAPVAGGEATGADSDADAPAQGEIEITSPMVGTFYSSASPESPPFVDSGTEVTEDTVVCIVEAMKVMNEIKAEKKGTITRVVPENGTPVQFGEPLFHLRPA